MADVQGMRFWKRHCFLTIADDGAVRLWDERCQEMSMELSDAHHSRVKGVDVLDVHHFVTGASDGSDVHLARSDFTTAIPRRDETLGCPENKEKVGSWSLRDGYV